MVVTKTIVRALAALVLVLGVAHPRAEAAAINFDFTFTNGIETATGRIVFDDTLLDEINGPTVWGPQLLELNGPTADPLIIDLFLTLSGAPSGNGTYTKSDFSYMVWDSAGIVLDFSQPLLGQGGWGPGGLGDFNLIADNPLAPSGIDVFQLSTASFDPLYLSEMDPVVPEPSTILLLSSGLGGFAFIARRKRLRKNA